MKNILVLGGAGFIGSHLVDRLLKDGNYVTVIDNFNTGKRENLQKHDNLSVLNMSILDDIDHLFEGIDVVFHLAALTRPQRSIRHPLEANHTNVQGTLKIMKHCQDNGVKRVVFTSSSSLYGTPEVFPTPETETPKPSSPYGLQKYMGELYAQLFGRMYGLEVNCIRPFNVYGSRQNPDGGYAPAVPAFIRNLNNDKQSFITGDGEQSRDFTYIDDIVEILMLASTSKVHGESFNAGAGNDVSIKYVYQTISKIMGKDIEPDYIEALQEPRRTLADISKAERLLGWKPKVKIEDGLQMTVGRILNEDFN